MSATAAELLQGYSQALYATWLWYRPFRVLFDAGEGVALRLQNGVFGVRQVFLSHGHLDHIAGLPSLLNLRNSGMGDPAAPLSIYHPAGDPYIALLRDYLERSNPTLPFALTWTALEPGTRIELDRGRQVEAFATRHTPGLLSLGYRVLELRRRLRPEHEGKAESELRELARRQGSDSLTEPYEHPLLVYGGDGLPPTPTQLATADLACLEATFVDPADRERPVHATFAEALAAAAGARVRQLVLLHVSGRYRLAQMRSAAVEQAARDGFRGALYLLWRDRLLTLGEGGAEPAQP